MLRLPAEASRFGTGPAPQPACPLQRESSPSDSSLRIALQEGQICFVQLSWEGHLYQFKRTNFGEAPSNGLRYESWALYRTDTGKPETIMRPDDRVTPRVHLEMLRAFILKIAAGPAGIISQDEIRAACDRFIVTLLGAAQYSKPAAGADGDVIQRWGDDIKELIHAAQKYQTEIEFIFRNGHYSADPAVFDAMARVARNLNVILNAPPSE